VSLISPVRSTIEKPSAIATALIEYAKWIITSQACPSLVIITSLLYPSPIMVAPLAVDKSGKKMDSTY
jgi:hypothetical protein